MTLLEALPPLPPATAILLALLLLTGWLAARVALLRRRQARRDPGDPPVPAARWLRALSDRPWLNLVLAVTAVLLAAGVVVSVVAG